jgi:hemerythrin
MLLNCEVETRNPGENLVKKGDVCKSVLMLVSGVVELIDSTRGISNLLPAGTMIGEYSVLSGATSLITYRTASVVKVLKIPSELYLRFIRRNYKLDETVRFHERMIALKTSFVFGDMISSSITSAIARGIKELTLSPGDRLESSDSELYLVKSGSLAAFIAEIPVDRIMPGQIFGEEGILLRSSSTSVAIADSESSVYAVPAKSFEGIPAVEWKLLETYERRINAFGAGVS